MSITKNIVTKYNLFQVGLLQLLKCNYCNGASMFCKQLAELTFAIRSTITIILHLTPTFNFFHLFAITFWISFLIWMPFLAVCYLRWTFFYFLEIAMNECWTNFPKTCSYFELLQVEVSHGKVSPSINVGLSDIHWSTFKQIFFYYECILKIFRLCLFRFWSINRRNFVINQK